MATTLALRQALLVDSLLTEGSLILNQSLALTTGQSYCVKDAVIADNYGEDSLWTAGEGGLDTFDYGFIFSDQDIWVQLRNSDTGAAEYARMFIPANVIFNLSGKTGANTTDGFDGAILVENTDYANVDKIEVMRNEADAVGDATVSLYLFI